MSGGGKLQAAKVLSGKKESAFHPTSPMPPRELCVCLHSELLLNRICLGFEAEEVQKALAGVVVVFDFH